MKFDLVDLRIFVSAIEGGSLTAAAGQNNIVVAAVSARLKKLEESFNLKLFERTGRGFAQRWQEKSLREMRASLSTMRGGHRPHSMTWPTGVGACTVIVEHEYVSGTYSACTRDLSCSKPRCDRKRRG
ncbi:LysR family transcriptional regulator [Ochrobactrum pseudogrignonense]|nr:LysR family transcriptional regulator [Brucella pseudogrignonensis]